MRYNNWKSEHTSHIVDYNVRHYENALEKLELTNFSALHI